MEKDYINLFSSNLKRIRCEKGLTQLQLAQKINYSEKAISKWENGTHIPPMNVVIALAETLNVSLADLFGDKN